MSLAIGASCTPPCEALAEQICECGLNQREELACLEIIRSAPGRVTTIREDELCSQRMETCTCEALEDGELALCGLAK